MFCSDRWDCNEFTVALSANTYLASIQLDKTVSKVFAIQSNECTQFGSILMLLTSVH